MQTGDPIPDVTLPDAGGTPTALRTYDGAPLVVYFYPKDDTPGCTTEAKDFTALADRFAAAGARVVGISKDSVARHATFAAKHDLSVTLLADQDGAACAAFGTWVQKKLYGREYMGIERATFLFAADGTLTHIWRSVKVKGHADAVATAAEALKSD